MQVVFLAFAQPSLDALKINDPFIKIILFKNNMQTLHNPPLGHRHWPLALLLGLLLLGWSGCTTTELDENERALVAKQQLTEKFDQLFEQAFTDPENADKAFQELTFNDLISGDKNLLADQEVRVFQTFVSVAVRLNRDLRTLKEKMARGTLFDSYIARNEVMMAARSTLYELPYRVRSGKKYERVRQLVAEMDAQSQKIIDDRRAALPPAPAELTGTEWFWRLPLTQDLELTMPDLLAGAYKGLKDVQFDFILQPDYTMNTKRFFLLPSQSDGLEVYDAGGDWSPEKAEEPTLRYAVYDGKIFFRIPLKNNADMVTGKGGVEREWYYEFSYRKVGNKLILSQPRIGNFIVMIQVVTNSDTENFRNNYPVQFQEITLTPKP